MSESYQAVRGGGRIDNWLAGLRHRLARRKLAGLTSRGRCLDIGCGHTPVFLLSLDFKSRVGIENNMSAAGREAAARHGVEIVDCDLAQTDRLPFEDASFDAVTMLAVIEHLYPPQARRLLGEIHRVLRPGGMLAATTPAAWTDGLLRTLAALRLISREEIDDHKDLFTRRKLARLLTEAGFDPTRLRTGCFEGGMNLWVTARKA